MQKPAQPNVFASGPLNRQSERRTDQAWIASRRVSAESRFVPVWRQRSLINGNKAVILDGAQAADLLPQADPVVYLGEWQERSWFALEMSGLSPDAFPDVLRTGEFKELRF